MPELNRRLGRFLCREIAEGDLAMVTEYLLLQNWYFINVARISISETVVINWAALDLLMINALRNIFPIVGFIIFTEQNTNFFSPITEFINLAIAFDVFDAFYIVLDNK